MRRGKAKNGKRWVPVALALLRLLLLAGFLYGAKVGLDFVYGQSDLEVAAIKNRPKPEHYLHVDETVEMTVIDDKGQRVMIISGETVTMSADQRTVTFTGGQATYFEGGSESLRMKSGEIIYNTQTEDFDLVNGLEITTKDGMSVSAEEVEWRRFKESGIRRSRPPSFRFPKGVQILSRDGNQLSADYMQSDRELTYMEFVGHVRLTVAALTDTEFITERKLTDVGKLKLEDFEKITITAEQVIYDKANQVLLATSRYYDRAFRIKDYKGSVVQPSKYQATTEQVIFAKKEITIGTNHLEAHIGRQWVECFGDINMVVPPAEIKESDDRSLRTMKRFETRISAGDLEYFWGRDYIISHSRTRVEQEDRLALADTITYWGDQKMVLLDGAITMVQGSGQWLFQDGLVDVKNADQSRMLAAYTELTADRAVMYLNNNDFIASGEVLMRQDNREAHAETLVYQDEIKRITAKGDVKFKERDGQTILCNALVYHNQTHFMEVEGGMTASIRLPAKFANDINRAFAEAREKPVPAEIADPPIPNEPTRNPNSVSKIKKPASRAITPAPPAIGLELPKSGAGAESSRSADPKELLIPLGSPEDDDSRSDDTSAPGEANGGED